jgi:hypothetical protein
VSKEEKPGDDVPPDNHRVKIKSIGEALGFLFRGLHEANQQFIEGEDAGRLGVIAAVSTTIEFLSFFESTTDLRQPLIALLSAVMSLDDGNVPPLLKPHPRPGRRPASAARESDKALAAGTVHRLCQTGLDINEAFEKVAKVCRKAGLKPGRKGAKDSRGQEPEITGRTVRGWCEKIAEDVGRHLQAAQTFDRLRQSHTPEAQANRQAIKSVHKETTRNALLEGLRRSLVQMRAPEH